MNNEFKDPSRTFRYFLETCLDANNLVGKFLDFQKISIESSNATIKEFLKDMPDEELDSSMDDLMKNYFNSYLEEYADVDPISLILPPLVPPKRFVLDNATNAFAKQENANAMLMHMMYSYHTHVRHTLITNDQENSDNFFQDGTKFQTRNWSMLSVSDIHTKTCFVIQTMVDEKLFRYFENFNLAEFKTQEEAIEFGKSKNWIYEE